MDKWDKVESRWGQLFTTNLNFLMTVLGGLFLGILILSLGWGEVMGHLSKIGPGWLSIVGQEILHLLVNAAGRAPHQRNNFLRDRPRAPAILSLPRP